MQVKETCRVGFALISMLKLKKGEVFHKTSKAWCTSIDLIDHFSSRCSEP